MDNRFLKDEKGFTGLEAAIVLIAFVVVAAVFSYVMLGAGFFTTQKSQEVVHTGVTQSSSSLAPSGDVIVKGSDINGGTADAGGASNEITFYITNTAGGTPVDLDKVVITYTDDENFISRAYTENGGYVDGLQTPPDRGTLGPHNPSAFDGAAWAKTTGWNYFNVLPTGTNDNLISSGEKYKVIIYLPEFIDHANPDDVVLPVVNEKFKIEVKPPEGAVLSITKTLPAALAKGSYYQVY